MTDGQPAGGLYWTDDGKIWHPISVTKDGVQLSITSCAIHPDPTIRDIYICTRFDGLYHASNVDKLRNDEVTAELVPEYPFRAPVRVFYLAADDGPNPAYEVWVASNGHGLHVLQGAGLTLKLDLGRGLWAQLDGSGVIPPAENDRTHTPLDPKLNRRAVSEDVVQQVLDTLAHEGLDDVARERLRRAIEEQLGRRGRRG